MAERATQRIILDTNFILIPGEFGIDVFSELERICHFPYSVCVLDGSIQELHAIERKQRGAAKRAARLGLELLKAKQVSILPMGNCRDVDSALVLWGKTGAGIATQDKDLKRILKSQGILHITMRKKSYLFCEGEPCITKKK